MTADERDHIISCLEDAEAEFDVYSHKHIHTSEEAAEERDHDLSETVKSLVLSTEEGPVLYALPGDRLVDFNEFADQYGCDDVTLSDPEDVEELTGCEVGSVPPFGPCLGIPSFADKSIFEKDFVHASIGTHTDSVKINTDVFDQLDFSVVSCSYPKD